MSALLRVLSFAARRAWLVALLLVVLAPIAALARPGGGESFGGGGGGGGGGGDDTLGLIIFLIELIFRLVVLCIDAPAIGFPLVGLIVIAIGVLWIKGRSAASRGADWTIGSGGSGSVGSVEVDAGTRGVRRRLEAIREVDPDFSMVLFEDFLHSLYAEVQAARGAQRLARLAPYLSTEVRMALVAPELQAVRDVIVGAMTFRGAEGTGAGSAATRVTVDFESNYTEVKEGGAEVGFYCRERWVLARAAGARSRPPERVRVIGCPSCGGPLDEIAGGQCARCGKLVEQGGFDWVVVSARAIERAGRPPVLGTQAEERGTDAPTIIDPEVHARLRALGARDPALTMPAFEKRLALLFGELQAAWTARDPARERPFVSDGLWMSHRYWLEAYRKQGLRNVTERARITRVEFARVDSDRWFDSITVRVHATGLDYTVSDDGRLVSGSRTAERPYSEYWTLIRGSSRKGAPRADRQCPSCGAPLKISMAGACEYCKAKVTSGEFDWILSRIEQDEVYGG